ncbi:copper amine oxidase N-terminal domain-containing protein [Anaerophilus nitritogenes]|uniref:copper amine oxidase N-terminal domain-containing protein n=1 Tax=Anaerophilus nitritogenes TaxID=2498136 RepID=UPI00101C3E6D|nr:copper amine oxidase N-terminal domain-containing protein [Anaerophilus nitritogenes]
MKNINAKKLVGFVGGICLIFSLSSHTTFAKVVEGNPVFISDSVYSTDGLEDSLIYHFAEQEAIKINDDRPLLMVKGTFLAAHTMTQNNRVFIPLRVVAEGLDAKVDWNPDNQTITITKDNIHLLLTINKKEIKVNDEIHQLEAFPILINNTTYVPLRFVAEYLGYEVGYEVGSFQKKQASVFHNSVVWIDTKKNQGSHEQGLKETKNLLFHLLEIGEKEKAGLENSPFNNQIDYFLGMIPRIKEDIENIHYTYSIGRYDVFQCQSKSDPSSYNLPIIFDTSSGKIYAVSYVYPTYSVYEIQKDDIEFFLKYYVFG